MRRERTFQKAISSLGGVFEFLADCLAEEDLGEEIEFCLDFVLEEIFTNLVKHNESSRNEVLVAVEPARDRVLVELTDFEVEPFDPDTAPEVDVSAPLEERSPGGLGLHLVKSMVDKLTYEYRDRNLRVTICKNVSR